MIQPPELVSSIVQARVQVMAAQAMLSTRMNCLVEQQAAALECGQKEESERLQLERGAILMDVRRLERCLGVLHDVMDHYVPKDEEPQKKTDVQ